MNKELKNALNIYYEGIDETMKNYQKNDKYGKFIVYEQGFKKIGEILKKQYENEYKVKYIFSPTGGSGINPRIFIKKENSSAKDGIYIYASFNTTNKKRVITLALEIGEDDRYEDQEIKYFNNIKAFKIKYKDLLLKLKNNLPSNKNYEIIDNSKNIFQINIKNVDEIIEYIDIFRPIYNKILEDITKYQLENSLWQKNWEQYQKELFKENYLKPVIKNKNKEKDQSSKEETGFNRIYYGIPGCGKSSFIKNEYNLNEKNSTTITFYPDYTNSDFIGQLLPKRDKDNDTIIRYEFEPGPFTIALTKALESNKPHYLVIEEINRGNAPAIFGDIFQILDRNQNGESEFQINNKAITDHLRKELKKNFEKVYLPSNLNILATMNTNDQNVYPLDTAFKRRWEMHLIKNKFDDNIPYDKKLQKMLVPGTNITWKEFVNKINKAILERNHNRLNGEDKQIGKYFVSEKELIKEKDNKDNIEIKRKFGEKVLMYLWEDVAKMNMNEWFDDYNSYEKLLEDYEENSEKVINNMLNGISDNEQV